MIAASEPQEFIPSGRQQVSSHPGLPKYGREGVSENFIIDSFVVKRLEQVSLSEEVPSEWWIVRESVENYGEFGKFDKEQSENKIETFDRSNVCSNDSWSWKTVDPNISAKTPGRLSDFSTKLPNKSRFSDDFLKSDSKTSSSKSSKSRLSLSYNLNFKTSEIKPKNVLSSMEEELYVKGCTAIWSKGILSTNNTSNGMKRVTLCAYTMDTPIKHAIWCKFYLEWPSFVPEEIWNKPDEPLGDSIPSICLIDSNNLRVFTEKGEDFRSNLPFQITGIWTTKFGIIVEREVSNINQSFYKSNTTTEFEITQPFIYSLSHPLDDFCPVALKSNTCNVLNNSTFKIIFTCAEPSICLVYDLCSMQHCVFLFRRLKSDEWNDISRSKSKSLSTMPSSFSISQKVKQSLSIWSGHGAGLPLATGSPYSSRATSLSSLVSPHSSRPHSPMAQISRGQSPCVSPFLSDSGWVNRGSVNHEENMAATQMDNTGYIKQVEPEFCFESVWNENISAKSGFGNITGPANKAFLCTDMVGQKHLCYLIPSRVQLILVRMDLSNDNNLIFGTSYCLTAKDAVSIPDLHMIAILDPACHVMLYSGSTKIGKLHVGGVSAEFSASPFVMQNIPSYFKSPFPRRSSLLPHALMSVPKFDEHLLSPVHPATSNKDNRTANLLHSTLLSDPFTVSESTNNNLIGLRDSVADRITLQYSDNTFYRITLPTLASGTLVESCLNSLRQALQRDVAMTLLCKWYAMRNAPGPTDPSVDQEFKIFSTLLFSLLGYDVERLNNNGTDRSTTPDEAKKQRPSPQGSSSDWEQMIQSEQHHVLSTDLSHLLNLTKTYSTCGPTNIIHGQVNVNAELFPYIRLILFTLHLLYEELKLNTTRLCELPLLVKLLHQIASDLRLEEYVIHYWQDYPEVCNIGINIENSQFSISDLSRTNQSTVLTTMPVSVMRHFYNLLMGIDTQPYPYIKNVNPRSKKFIQICGSIVYGQRDNNADINIDTFIKTIVPPGTRCETEVSQEITLNSYHKWSSAEKVVYLMTQLDITRRDLDNVPAAINFVFHETLWQCRENPPTDWTAEAYFLIQRPDLAVQANYGKKHLMSTEKNASQSSYSNTSPATNIKQYDQELDDGMDDIETSLLQLRFPDDRRVAEVRRLLQSSEPVDIRVVQRPEVSDHDFIEEQEKHLYAICTRTMALSLGRGMFTLRTATPLVTEPLPVPKLNLSGRGLPRGAAVELTHIDTPPNMNLWPLFHNGVAAGLRISPDASDIDSTWIVFNKPKSTAETAQEHAGFLMALGLNGHLKNLARMNTYDYLIKFHELTSVGLLIGLAATQRGSMDTASTKMLSIHIEALLPPTSMELDIPQNIQVAALLGIGLVYQGSAHRHITEVLLTEIGRPPGPEMENSVDRESYALAAGLALGLVTLKQGGHPCGLGDLGVPDMLHYYMVGGNKRLLTGSQKDKYKVPSFQIREGHTVNLDVTAPGATLALGLMYIGSGNKAIADWMKPPETQYLFDFVRPDFLMLRVVSRALILWDDIRPNVDWVENQVPEAIKPFCLVKPSTDIDFDIDYEAVNQAYCNIVGGACFAMGLRYAGSADENAFNTLYHYCRMFTSLTGKSIAELAGKPTIETCLNLVLLSLSMVMAGTGRLEVLRLCRHLRKRVGVASSSVITYGSHLVTHMALGLLFLGGGRFTLSNSPASVAAMLCAFFPKFPTHSNDNRYHLQAFRHLYVLAVEPRLIIPRDIITSRMCYTDLSVVYLDGTTVQMRAPCLLPDLNTLSRVCVQDERYWPVVFERGRNWDKLVLLLEENRFVEVKQRAGCLSYIEDPVGSRSLLARVLTQSNNIPWVPSANSISSFSSENTVRLFTEDFLTSTIDSVCGVDELSLRQLLTTAMYDCVTKDKMAILSMWIFFIKALQNMKTSPNMSRLWQLKLLFATVLSFSTGNSLISSEIVLSLKQQIVSLFDKWEIELSDAIKSYMCGENINISVLNQHKLAGFITFYDIPHNINVDMNSNFLQVFANLNSKGLSSVTVKKIVDILSINK